MSLGRRLRELREQAGLSQNDLADQIDLERSYISQEALVRLQRLMHALARSDQEELRDLVPQLIERVVVVGRTDWRIVPHMMLAGLVPT